MKPGTPSPARERKRGLRMANAKSGDSREAILRAALKTIARVGYADASVGSIAKEAGVNSVTVFRLFEGKENLFREVVARFAHVQLDETALDAELDGLPSADEALTGMAAAYFESVFRHKDMLRIFIVEAPHFDFVRREAWYCPPAVLRHCRRRLEVLAGSGERDAGELDRLAEMFVTHVVRRAMEYNKHDSIWRYDAELAADFSLRMQPQIRLMTRFLDIAGVRPGTIAP